MYLVLALATWVIQAAAQAGWLPGVLLAWTPVYIHLFTVGWLSQLIFGVAHWMLPMYSKERPRGREELIWIAWGTLNGGLVVRALVEPLATRSPGSVWGWGLVIAAALQWLAAVLFVVNTWPRVKPRRTS